MARLETTNAYSIDIDNLGHYIITKLSTGKDICLQGDSAGLFGQIFANIQCGQLPEPQYINKINWLCSGEFA